MRHLPCRPSRLLSGCLVTVTLLLQLAEVQARVGGGHSYSGSSNGGSSGSSGSIDGDLINLLLWLVFRHPTVGIPLVLIGGTVYFFCYRRTTLPGGFTTRERGSVYQTDPEAMATGRSRVRLPFVPMLERDPQFSLPLFLDFASALAQRSLTAFNTPALGKMEPYVSAGTFARFPAGVVLDNVVVGAVTVRSIAPFGEVNRITVAISFCANAVKGEKSESFWFESEWLFSRKAGVVSKGPAEMLKLACPSCGATADKDESGACTYCGNRPAPGSEAWTVTTVTVTKRESRPPVDLGSYAAEKGTMLPTVFSPMLNTALVGIINSDHGFNKAEAEQRFRRIFMQLQEAWSKRDMAAIRPLVTDQLYRVYCYWIKAYRAAGIRNMISNVAITSVETVAADIDPFYDSITARIAATMVDRCIDEGGKVVGGDSTPRAFSEYWTFVRIAGEKATADPVRICTDCGASLETGMSGECPYCGMLVSGKNFDWILSRITQDEDYGR